MVGSPASARPARGSRAGTQRIALGAGAVVVLAVVAFLVLRSPGAPVRSEAAFLQERAAVLQNQMELVKEDARYLLLDPDRGAITLFHGGVPLRSWPVLSVEAGARRVGEEEEGWRSRRWDLPRIEPPVERERRVLLSDSVEPPDLTGAVDWVPPTPEEAVPTPASFIVHYEGGMGLEVVAVEPDVAADSVADTLDVRVPLLHGVRHRLYRFLPRNWDRYRIRVSMPFDDAGSLYRSLPDSTSLLAIIPRH
ncbi:MAG: hypothetical protein FIA95_13370 [Gemmatimonadetes bacterium]|nr:hypothetical protein [Gemmatimonadota bacterium]